MTGIGKRQSSRFELRAQGWERIPEQISQFFCTFKVGKADALGTQVLIRFRYCFWKVSISFCCDKSTNKISVSMYATQAELLQKDLLRSQTWAPTRIKEVAEDGRSYLVSLLLSHAFSLHILTRMSSPFLPDTSEYIRVLSGDLPDYPNSPLSTRYGERNCRNFRARRIYGHFRYRIYFQFNDI